MQKEESPLFFQEIISTLAIHNYEIKEKIGSGGFASVYKCRNTKYNEIFCVKVIEIPKDAKNSLFESFDSESQTLVKIIHPNIITIYDHFKSEHCFYLILEYCPNGSIWDIILKRGEPLEGQELIGYIRQILQATNYIHSIGIAHRDIKPHNILIDAHKRPKLADFGFAEFYDADLKQKSKYNGSLAYMAPELLQKREYNPTAVDIWALGVTFYQMATGKLPWSNVNVYKEITSGYLFIPNNMDQGVSQLIRKMIQLDASQRPSCYQLLDLPLFKNNVDQRRLSFPTMHLKQMSFLSPIAPSSLNSGRIKPSASSSIVSQVKPRRKIEPQGSGVFARKRISLSFTFSEDDDISSNNVSDSLLC